MIDRPLVREIVTQMLEAIRRVERLDGICMMLIAIGESCKNLDKVTAGELLPRYPEIDWKGVSGIRDVISHHHFDVDADVVFSVCRKHIPSLRRTLETMLGYLDA